MKLEYVLMALETFKIYVPTFPELKRILEVKICFVPLWIMEHNVLRKFCESHKVLQEESVVKQNSLFSLAVTVQTNKRNPMCNLPSFRERCLH